MSRTIDNPEALILSTAKNIILNEGLAQLNMRKLATHCDVALGTLYNYFPTKMALLNTVIEDFWRSCFENFYKTSPKGQTFFMALRNLYFYLVEYLNHFKTNWLDDLSRLPQQSKLEGKAKEHEFMKYFEKTFSDLLYAHNQEFDSLKFSALNIEKFSTFILNNFLMMLKASDADYDFFEFLLKQLLM